MLNTVFVRNKSTNVTFCNFFNKNFLFFFTILNRFLVEKVILPESAEKYAQIKQNIYWWIQIWEVNRGQSFSQKCYYGLWIFYPEMTPYRRIIQTNKQLITSQNIIGVEWITCRISCFTAAWSFWRHPFTAENPLMSKWCNAKFLQICSDEETNSSTTWMAKLGGGGGTFSANFLFF